MGTNFIMSAVRNERIKEKLGEYAKGNILSVTEYGMGQRFIW
jgi:hypothetical protein